MTPSWKIFIKKYCKILTSTIQLAKKLHYNELISQSINKTNTAWSVIKSLTNKQVNKNEELMLNIEGKLIKNTQSIEPLTITSLLLLKNLSLTFRHRASCILGQAFHYSPENAFYIFNQQIYFIIWYLLDRVSLI